MTIETLAHLQLAASDMDDTLRDLIVKHHDLHRAAESALHDFHEAHSNLTHHLETRKRRALQSIDHAGKNGDKQKISDSLDHYLNHETTLKMAKGKAEELHGRTHRILTGQG